MEFLSLWVWILIVSGSVFFIAFAIACDMWTERDPKKLQNIIAGVMISSITAFKVFVLATIIFSVLYLLIVNV